MDLYNFDLNLKKEQWENVNKYVYTHGFPLNFSEEDLKKLFSKSGTVTNAYINKDESGVSKRNGVVTFSTIDGA